MGNWFTRSNETTKQRLEKIQNEIEQLEHSKWVMLRSQKHIIGFYLFGTVLLYLIASGTFYLYYFENSSNVAKCQFFFCLFAVPLFIYFSKRLLQTYYGSLSEKYDERLIMLRKDKRTILDTVMETETYKVAKELLEKYDPGSLAKDKPQQSREWKMPNQTVLVQRSMLNNSQMAPNTPRPVSGPSTPPNMSAMPLHATPVRQPIHSAASHNTTMQNMTIQHTPNRPLPFAVTPMNPMNQSIRPPMQMSSLSRPIAPQDRSIVEKMVDYMIGDGPNNRYALICMHCSSHNGMALKEEFEYLAFRCCYCMGFNPARKQKPVAPRLAQHYQLTAPANHPQKSDSETNPTSVTEPESDAESEIDKLRIEEIANSENEKDKEGKTDLEEAIVTSSDDNQEEMKNDKPNETLLPAVSDSEMSGFEGKDDLEFIDKEEVTSS